MLVLDRHESHVPAGFEDYCQTNRIITISIPVPYSYLFQPLDVALYSPIKRVDGDQTDLLIRASINHITKSEFFLVS